MEMLDPDSIYDPSMRSVPKVKQIFKISKEHNRSLSCKSSHSGSSYIKPTLLGTDSNESKNDLITYKADY